MLMITLCLFSCGQKGPLFLPEDTSRETQRQSVSTYFERKVLL